MAKASVMVHVFEMCWGSYWVFAGKTPNAGLLPCFHRLLTMIKAVYEKREGEMCEASEDSTA